MGSAPTSDNEFVRNQSNRLQQPGRREPKSSRSVVVAVVLFLAGLGVPAVSTAQDDPDDDPRPPLQELIRTRVVYPQERREIQITARSLFDGGTAAKSLEFPLGVEYGLTDKWQVELEWSALHRVSSAGESAVESGRPSIGTQYSFMNIGGSRVHTMFGAEAALDVREIEPYTAFAVDLNSRGVQLFGDASWEFARASGDEESEREARWGAGMLMPLGAATLATEFEARRDDLVPGRPSEMYVIPSVTLRPASRWEIGVGLPVGVTRDSNRLGLSVLGVYER
jgi:hypothetical protein